MYDELVKRLREHNGWALNETLDDAADAIEELMRRCEQFQYMPLPAWVPVTERLPLYGQDVLAVRTYGDGEKCQEVLMAHIAVWNEETGDKWWNATNITHWMPLPEPPKNEQMDLIGDGKRCEEVCKHAPPEKWKWPCDDCDMRFHDRAEPPKEEDDE